MQSKRVQDPENWEEALPSRSKCSLRPRTACVGRSFFCVKVDMGTESLQRFKRKLVACQAYWRSGAYTEQQGFFRNRVLTIAEGVERLANLVCVAAELDATNMFLLRAQRVGCRRFAKV